MVGSVPSSVTLGAACRAKACSLWPQSSPIQAAGGGRGAGGGARTGVGSAGAVVVFMMYYCDDRGFGPGRSMYSETLVVGT